MTSLNLAWKRKVKNKKKRKRKIEQEEQGTRDNCGG
jgi:hypothetical protein